MKPDNHQKPNVLQEVVIEGFNRMPIPPTPDDADVLNKLRETDSAESSTRSPGSSLFWRLLQMKYTKPISSAAALLILTVVLAFVLLSPGITPQQALARMANNIRAADAVSCQMTLSSERGTLHGIVHARGTAVRVEMGPDGRRSVNVIDHAKGKMLSYATGSNQATLWDTGQVGFAPNVVDRLRNLAADNAEYLGEERLNDQISFVYEIQEGGGVGKVWVDAESLLPIRVEMEADGLGKVIYGDFNWNAQPDASLFSLEAPEGYTLRETTEITQ